MTESDQQRRRDELAEDLDARHAFEQAPYRAVVNDMTELVVRWKPGGMRIFVNDAYCRLFGRPREELIGSSFWSLVADKDLAHVKERISKLSPDNPVSTDVHRAVAADRSEIWMEWTDRALFDDNDNVVEYQSVGRDITRRVQIEQQLRRLDQADATSRASAVVAHDLANLMMVIRKAVADIRKNPSQQLQLIEEALDRGEALVSQLRELRYGRVKTPKQIDLNQCVNNALLLLGQLGDTDIVLKTKLAPEHCTILGNPTQIDQILLNLVRNAAEATSGSANILLETETVELDKLVSRHRWRTTPPAVCRILRVTDQSGGIDAKLLPHIFEPNVSTKPAGQGIGLATVMAIVLAHNASIRVDNTRNGSCFEIAFPAVYSF